ncbi:interleukin-11 receptor subunit alpha [Conger conger]|nr:interleukin-11 receptor subunit alpha [Conger conger]XP_061119494.1 interleukin-11 receptor subunit alpha [Conger conger]
MPGKAPCPGGLIVIGIMALCAAHTRSEIWSNEVSDTEYGKLGSNVTLVCKPSWTGYPVEWRLNGSAVLPRQTLPSNSTLTLINTDLSMEGNYSCLDQKGNLLWATKLRLGHLPGLVSISCWMFNHHSLHCFWEQSVKTHLPTKYLASYRDWSNRVEPCLQDSSRPNKCTILDPSTWQHYHTINITELNPLGTETTLARVQLHDLLKPDPPEEVTPEAVVGHPRRLLVRWRYPSSWPLHDSYPLCFQLRYRPLGSIHWSLVNSSQLSLVITDALAAHAHQVQVQAMDALLYGHWSDWSREVQGWPWREPKPDPEVSEPPDEIPTIPDYTEMESSTTRSPDADGVAYRSLGVLISLGLFAGVFLSILSALIVFLWVRQRQRGGITKQELTSMVKMKSLPL